MFQQALRLLPIPRERWEAGTWLVVAIGDCRFAQRRFAEALAQFRIAEAYPGGSGNALVLLRIGECLVELDGDKQAAMDALTRAQSIEGGAIFAQEDPKYLRFFLRNAPME